MMRKSSEVPLAKEFDLLTFCHYRSINVLQRQDPWWLFWSSFSHFALNYWRRWASFLSSTHILKTSLKDNAKENSYLIFINFTLRVKKKLTMLTLSSFRWKTTDGSQSRIKTLWMVKLETFLRDLGNTIWQSWHFYKQMILYISWNSVIL